LSHYTILLTLPVLSLLFLLLIPPPPPSTLFPYTTLFRSSCSTASSSPLRRSWSRRSTSPSSPMARCWAWRRSWPPSSADSTRCRSEEHTSELQSRFDLVCRLLLEKKKRNSNTCT